MTTKEKNKKRSTILTKKREDLSEFTSRKIPMGKGIEPTPILHGEDAERLLRDFYNPPNKKERRAFMEEAIRIYEQNPPKGF